jgi:hypothetical protein
MDYTGRRPKSIREFESDGAHSWREMMVARLAESLPWPDEP